MRRELRRRRALSPAARRREARARKRPLRAAGEAPASEVGRWEAPFALPIVAIHSAVLPTGKVMMWAYPFTQTAGGARALETHAWLWDPAKGTGSDAFHEVSPPPGTGTKHAMLFCGGGSLLADGRLLTTGGTLYWPSSGSNVYAGTKEVWTFDPWSERWTRQPDMHEGRWYPSQVELADGRTVILSGLDSSHQGTINIDLEVFTPSPDAAGVGTIRRYPGGARPTFLYPHLFTMPDGNVLLAGPDRIDSALLATGGDAFTWTQLRRSSATRATGAAFLEPAGPSGSTRVTQLGGLGDGAADGSAPPRETAETLDTAHAGDGWQPAASLNVGRAFMNAVVLPDSSVVAVGGGNGRNAAGSQYVSWPDNRGRQVELRDPTTGAWSLGPAQQEDRAYHSTAVLLPDGRVLSGGDDRVDSSDNGEVYSPPYLFRGPRPTIQTAPVDVRWGSRMRIDTGGPAADRAVLMAPAVTTHAADMQSRHVELQILSRDPAGIEAVAPPSGAVAPPGWYMLFVLSSDGVPSVARWVHVHGAPPAAATVGPPALGGFAAAAQVGVLSRRVRLRGRSVTVRLENESAFAVPVRGTLRLGRRGTAASAASDSVVLAAGRRQHLRLVLGHSGRALVRRRGRVPATLTLVVRDPGGGTRTVRRMLALLSPS